MCSFQAVNDLLGRTAEINKCLDNEDLQNRKKMKTQFDRTQQFSMNPTQTYTSQKECDRTQMNTPTKKFSVTNVNDILSVFIETQKELLNGQNNFMKMQNELLKKQNDLLQELLNVGQ